MHLNMDLYRIFKPVIFISRVFCLAPFTAVEHLGSTIYQFSTFWLLYSVLGMCASFVSQVRLFWYPFTISNEPLYNAFSQILSAATCVVSVVIQVLCLSNGKNVVRILDHVSVLDSEHSGAPLSYYRLYKVFIVHLICCIISIVALNVVWFASVDINSAYIFEMAKYSIVYFICDVVVLLSDIQFIHFVHLLKYRFSVLNDTLINFTVLSLYKTSVNHVVTAQAVGRSVNSNTSAVSSSNTALKSTLRRVCRHHDSLCDISEFVNRTYSLQILLSVIFTAFEVLYMAYSCSAEISNPTLNFYSSVLFFSMSTLVGLFAESAKLVQLVVVCNSASHEVSGLQLWCPYFCS
jgi:hypothetical protein